MALDLPPVAYQTALQREQLVVGQPPSAQRVLDQRPRLVAGDQRVAAQRQPARATGSRRAARRGGRRRGAAARTPASAAAATTPPHWPGTPAPGRWCAASRRPPSTSSWLLATISASIVASPLPANRESHLGLEVLGQVPLVEPHDHAGTRAVVHHGLDDHQVAASRRPCPYPIDRSPPRWPPRPAACPPGGRPSESRRDETARAPAGRPPYRTGGRSSARPAASTFPVAAGASRCDGEGAELGRGNAGLSRPSNDLMRRGR